MPRGRKPLNDPPTQLWVWVPKSLSDQLNLVLLDPMRMRTAYGSKSSLVTALLRLWLKDRTILQGREDAPVLSSNNTPIEEKEPNAIP